MKVTTALSPTGKQSSLTWESWGLIAFVAVFPFLEGFSNAETPIGTQLLGLCMASVWLAGALLRGIRIGTAAVPMVLLVAWCLVTSMWSREPVITYRTVARLALAVALYLLIFDSSVGSIRKIYAYICAYVAGVGVLAVSSAANIIRGETYNGMSNRFSAIGSDPNNFGIMAVSAIPLALVAGENSGTFFRIFSWIYAAGLGLITVATGSRGAAVAAFVVVGGYLFLQTRAQNLGQLSALACIVAIAGYVGASYLIPMQAVERLQNSTNISSADDRLVPWRLAYEAGIASVPLGVGFGASLPVVGLQAHNTFLSFFAETGPIGCLLWIVLWISHAHKLWRVRRNTAYRNLIIALALSSCAMGIAALTLNWEYRKPIYFLWALVASSAYTIRQKQLNQARSHRH